MVLYKGEGGHWSLKPTKEGGGSLDQPWSQMIRPFRGVKTAVTRKHQDFW